MRQSPLFSFAHFVIPTVFALGFSSFMGCGAGPMQDASQRVESSAVAPEGDFQIAGAATCQDSKTSSWQCWRLAPMRFTIDAKVGKKISRCIWDFGDGTGLNHGTPDGNGDCRTSHVYAREGSYQLRVRVITQSETHDGATRGFEAVFDNELQIYQNPGIGLSSDLFTQEPYSWPRFKTNSYSSNVQGLSHDETHWYVSQEVSLSKFPATENLNAPQNYLRRSLLPHSGVDSNGNIAVLPSDYPELYAAGVRHFGDVDFYEGYLYVPIEKGGNKGVAVFDSELNYITHAQFPVQSNDGVPRSHASWVAINPVNGLLYASDNNLNDEPVYRYHRYNDPSGHNFLSPAGWVNLRLENKKPIERGVRDLLGIQGGTFSPNGLLFLSTEPYGIYTFDLGDDGLASTGVLREFMFIEYKPHIRVFWDWYRYEELEGLTYWDLDKPQFSSIPWDTKGNALKGNLHLAQLWNKGLQDDRVWIKHMRVGDRLPTLLFDPDGDGVAEVLDNCPGVANPVVGNSGQPDGDGDGLGDPCDPAPACATRNDSDCDLVPDVRDACPLDPNYSSSYQMHDTDADGVVDVCDIDIDGDGLPNGLDTCPLDLPSEADHRDRDSDGIGNGCDLCPDLNAVDASDIDGDCIDDKNDPDRDGDGVFQDTGTPTCTGSLKKKCADNCPDLANPDQADQDGDRIGDACDDDLDGDGTLNEFDNCESVSNADQMDADSDGFGEACDPAPNCDNRSCNAACYCPDTMPMCWAQQQKCALDDNGLHVVALLFPKGYLKTCAAGGCALAINTTLVNQTLDYLTAGAEVRIRIANTLQTSGVRIETFAPLATLSGLKKSDLQFDAVMGVGIAVKRMVFKKKP
jgi:hypothetical protein